ncbi:MAG: ribulose-phosphate 3-epimerase [Dehalococcoidia bacterium]|nr:ribulose-phosphate 3-epimerase [Dehalococcoidia bacterium]
MSTVRIAPSILTADFGRLAEQVRDAEAGGADLFHLDVMDGLFVPPITFGGQVVAAVRAATRQPVEVHMMVAKPAEHFEELSAAGGGRLIFHWEAIGAEDGPEGVNALIQQVRALGCEVGIAINPETPAEAILPVLASLDEVVVMLIRPGWGGQPMMPAHLEKVRTLREHIDGRRLPVMLEVDGGVKAHNALECVTAGADTLVAGSAVYNPGQTPQEAIAELRAALG